MQFLFAALCFLLFYKLKNIAGRNIFTAWVYNLVGTIFHELSHYVIGFIFNAKPTSISLIPREERGYFVLGGVTCARVVWYNAMPLGFAPLILIPIAYLIYHAGIQFSAIYYVDLMGRVFIASVLLFSSAPSRQDIRVAFSSVAGNIFYGLVVFTTGMYLMLK